MPTIIRYSVHEVVPYINWIYFFHAWGFQPKYAAIANIHGCDACRAMWLASFPEEERGKAAEAMQLLKEANRMLHAMDQEVSVQALYRLCSANSCGDDLILFPHTEHEQHFPLLRQQTIHPETGCCLCLSDFVRPLSQGIEDTVGFFASSVSSDYETRYADDSYNHLLIQTLNDRLAEAAVEKMHLYIRKEAWAYSPQEQLSISELLKENFQGIRPAVGYPSLPDHSVNFLIDKILNFSQIGITLTENGAMHPHASVCGLMLAHPAAKYFSVGKIGDDQLIDYARRRGLSIHDMRKFLSANL